MAAMKDEDHGNDNQKHNSDSFQFQFGEKELEVSEILLNLPYLITNCVADYRFSYSWGTKRRRTILGPLPPPVTDIPKPAAPPASLEATSPVSPLYFVPSECEGKSKHQSTTRKSSVKRTREQLVRVIENETKNKQILMQEIDKMKICLQELQDENSELNAKKQKLILSTVEVRRETTTTHQQNNDSVHSGASTSTVHQHPQPWIHPPPPHHHHHQGGVIINPDPPVHNQQAQEQQQQQPGRGPLGFDLNVPATEETDRPVELQPPLDHHHHQHHNLHVRLMNRMRSNAARQRRIQLNKAKKAQRGK